MKKGKLIRNLGAVLVMISVPGCMACSTIAAKNDYTGFGIMTALGVVGLSLFIFGRMIE